MAMPSPAPQPRVTPFDELLVISNLCLDAGHAPFRADHGPALDLLVDEMARRSPGRRIGLVLNGNTFNFTSDAAGSGGFEPERSLARLEALIQANEPSLLPLRRVLQMRDCRLVLVLGNRDVDLVLPDVQARLTDALCGDDPVARRRLVLATDGHGLACTVGPARVLLVSGHEADPWNHIDFVELHDRLEAWRFSGQWQPWWPSAGLRLAALMQRGVASDDPWLLHMADETLGLYMLVAKDPGMLWRSALLAAGIATLITRSRRLKRLPAHARILPPPRIRYDDQPAPLPHWQGDLQTLVPAPVLPEPDMFGLLAGLGQRRRLERFGLALARRGVRAPMPTMMDLEAVVRSDVQLVVSGNWRRPALQLMANQGLHGCSGFWEPVITLGRQHARDVDGFHQACDAMFSGSPARLAAVDGLLMPRHVVHVLARNQGLAVRLRQHLPQQQAFVGVQEAVLPAP